MCLVGVVIAWLVNLFLQSGSIQLVKRRPRLWLSRWTLSRAGLSLLILLFAGLLLAFSAAVAHLPFVEAFMAVVGLSVAAIPEGLPATLTITLAV